MSRDQDNQSAQPRRKRWPGRVWRILKWTGGTLAVLLVVVIGLLAWVLATPSGTAFAWHRIQGYMPASIQVANVEGRLFGPLTLTGVRVNNQSTDLSVKKLELRWDPKALLHARLHIRRLGIAGVDYAAKSAKSTKPQKKSGSFEVPQSVKLPLSVQIDTIAVDHVTLNSQSSDKPFRVAKARVKDIALRSDQWQIGQITGHGPRFDLKASAGVTPKNGYPTKLSAQASLDTGTLAPIKANASVQGKLDDLAIDAGVTEPYNIQLSGRVQNALNKPELTLDVALNELKAHAIKPSLPKLSATADVGLRGSIDDLTIDVDASADSPVYGKAKVQGGIHYAPSAVTIDNLRVTSPQTDGQLKANGQLALGKTRTMDLKLAWSDLQWPLKDKPAYRTPKGQVQLTGTMDDYELTGDLNWQVVGRTQGQLQLAGSGSTSKFKLSKLRVTGGAGRIEGHAKARWAPSLQASAELTGHAIKPDAVVAGVSGNLDFNLDATAHQDKTGLTATVKRLTADGTLHGRPIQLGTRVQYVGQTQTIDVDHFRLDSGSAQARLSGHLGWAPDTPLDARFNIQAPQMAELWPTLAGALSAKGQLGGTVAKPMADAKLQANDLAYGDYTVGSAKLDADVDWSGQKASSIAADIRNVDAAGQHVDKLTLDADGRPAKHQVEIAFDGAGAKLKSTLTGRYQRADKTWQFRLSKLDAGYGQFEPWHLAGSAEGHVAADGQGLENACLESGEARVCLQGSHTASSGSKAHIKINDLAFAYLKPVLPKNISVSGTLSGEVSAKQPARGSPDLVTRLTTTEGQVQVDNADGKTVNVLSLQPGQIDARLRDRKLSAAIDLPFDQGGVQANVDVAAGKAGLSQRPLSGRLQVNIADFGFINQFSPQIGQTQGHMQGDLKLDGKLAEPSIQGQLKLDAPKLTLIQPGLTLKDLQLTAVGQGDRINLDGQVDSGGGTLKLNGQVGLGDAGQSVQLNIQGQDFEAVNIPMVQAFISPDLQLAITPKRIEANGTVKVPKASITPRDLPAAGATTVSGDQVIVGKKESAAKRVARKVHANIDLILGKDIHIEGFGLKTDVNGKLSIVQQPGQPATGSGQINLVDGSYRAYGQNLDITNGQILFGGGPLSAPAMDVKAARYPTEDVTVGVHVRGPLAEPNVNLFSEPSMTQSEQLSWLMLGRAPEDNSAGQSNLIAKAALALGSGRANSVLNKLGDKLGVDQIGVGSSPGKSRDNAAFTVGKYLTPKLYLSYGLGLFDQVSTVSLRYTLSSHWKLKTSSSSESTGGDVIFSIDH
ncbi:hypothetical protein HKX42_09285 [Salinisphaera sp. USBA-960]|nr:hypothetical protein [Salifodinibacter halophilus]NNC27067.1 hypothetical protein [Salifodinibacter halophilus]